MRALGAGPASGAPGGEGREQTSMRAAEDLDQGGQAQMQWLRRERKELERTQGENSCDVRGAGPTQALEEDWEEEAMGVKRLEEAGRMVG